MSDLDALRASLGTVSDQNATVLQRALDAATGWVTERVKASSLDRPDVHEAIVLLASRLYKRRQSPEGVSGWGDLGVVTILASDPDITRLLEHHIDYCNVGIA